MSDLRNKLAGSFELLLLFGRGVNRFTGTKDEALKSIVIPLLIYASSYVVGDLYVPPGMETGYSKTQIVLTLVGQFVLSFLAISILTYEFARWLKRSDKFWLFFSASNWTSIPMGAISLPIVFLTSKGVIPHDQMDRIFVVLEFYGYIVTGCIAYASFRLNWQLAIVVAVGNMFIDQQLWHFLYAVQGISLPAG